MAKSSAMESTYLKAQREALCAEGRLIQAIGRSRDGWATKLHALTALIRHPYAPMLTYGIVSDAKAALALLHRAGPMRYLLGDKSYDAD